MGFLLEKNSREMAADSERFACESVAQHIHALITTKREAPDFLLDTPQGILAIEVTDLRPPPSVVAAEQGGWKLLDILYDIWKNDQTLQKSTIHLTFHSSSSSMLVLPRQHDARSVSSQIRDLCHSTLLHIPDKTCQSFTSGQLSNISADLSNFFLRITISRHDHLRLLMPQSNLGHGPRGNWQEQLQETFQKKIGKISSYHQAIPPSAGIGLIINTHTNHFSHFDSSPEETKAASILLRDLNFQSANQFDCIFLAGPKYYDHDYQSIETVVEWAGK